MLTTEAPPVLPSTPAAQPAFTILVVDDEAGMRNLLTFALERHGHHVLTAHHGTMALALVEEQERQGRPLDLMITDLVMPGMNGVELADTLSARRPELKVIFTSGFPAAVAEGFGINVLRDTFLPKPISIGSLHATISKVMEMHALCGK